MVLLPFQGVGVVLLPFQGVGVVGLLPFQGVGVVLLPYQGVEVVLIPFQGAGVGAVLLPYQGVEVDHMLLCRHLEVHQEVEGDRRLPVKVGLYMISLAALSTIICL